MTAQLPSTALVAQALDFRNTAAGLAGQLQQASRGALLLADDLARAERIVNILVKYMPASQMIHARLEIDDEGMQAPYRATAAAVDVLTERRRQIEEEGWTPDYDDVQEGGELSEAAMCYADPAAHCQLGIPHHWPWMPDSWKPRDRRHNLVRAGALIIAEIERLDRAENPQCGPNLSNRDPAADISRAEFYRHCVEQGIATKVDIRAASTDQGTEQ